MEINRACFVARYARSSQQPWASAAWVIKKGDARTGVPLFYPFAVG